MNVSFRCRLSLKFIQTLRSSQCHQFNKYIPSLSNIHQQQRHIHLYQNKSLSHRSIANLIYFDITRSFCNTQPTETNTKNTETNNKIDKRAYPIAFSSLLMGIGIGVILPVMPQFANEIGLNTMQYGLVISVMGITRLLMNVPAAMLTDQFGRKSTLVGGPIISALGTLIIASAHTMNELIASRFVIGGGGSLQMAGAQAYLSDISTVQNRARTMAPLMIGFSAGAALGPFIGGALCDYYDSVRVPFIFVSAAIAAVAINNMYMLPETLKKEDRKRKMDNIQTILRTMATEWKQLCKNKNQMSGVAVHMTFWFAQAGATFTLMPLFATNELGRFFFFF